jgi:hypothetical protein
MHTYAFEASETTLYIHITAPEKACGKSRLMDVLVEIAAKPIRSGGKTAAALVRCIDNSSPNIFLDKMDAQLGGDKEYAEARGILNVGFQRGGSFFKRDGKSNELREFNAYSPKCFAGIGRIPDTVASRSIPIEMRRKLPGEHVESFRQRDVETAALPIRSGLREWVDEGAVETLTPQFQIAQLAGGDWLQSLIYNDLSRFMAERQGFEPWIPCGIHAFQACAFSHSAISPRINDLRAISPKEATRFGRIRNGSFRVVHT